MALLLSLVATAVTLLISFRLFRGHQLRTKTKSHGCESPRRYPHLEPFLGLDIFLKTGKSITENRYLLELWHRYTTIGHTFESTDLGSLKINSIEPENLKTVFVSKFNDWGVQPVRLPVMRPFCGVGFITTDGVEWERSRGLLKPSFRKQNISDLTPLEEMLQSLMSQIPRDGSTVDLQRLLFRLYLDNSTLFLFGESIGVLSGNTPVHAEGFLDAFSAGFAGSGLRIAVGPFSNLIPRSRWLESCNTTHQFANHYVDKALRIRRGEIVPNKRQERTLLSNMAEATEDRIDLRNQLIQAFMASQETTAALLSNVFWLLARDRRVWNKLRAEVLALGDTELAFDVLGQMKYMRKVLNEALRLYPVFPQMNRVALRDTVLPTGGGSDGQSPVFVPAGAGFDTAFYVLHRLPEIWGDDADKFRPERWGEFKPDSCEFVPFGLGLRMCAGQQKAMIEASYVVSRLMQEFHGMQAQDDRPWEGFVQLTAKNANGCLVSLSPASD